MVTSLNIRQKIRDYLNATYNTNYTPSNDIVKNLYNICGEMFDPECIEQNYTPSDEEEKKDKNIHIDSGFGITLSAIICLTSISFIIYLKNK